MDLPLAGEDVGLNMTSENGRRNLHERHRSESRTGTMEALEVCGNPVLHPLILYYTSAGWGRAPSKALGDFYGQAPSLL